MRLLYNIFIYLYSLSIAVASLFNPKAKAWISGRRGLLRKIKRTIRSENHQQTIWFHCASLGEFEQGRPVMEAFREKFPDWRLILTFFSPSGFEVRKNYPAADHVFYIPADTTRNAKRFIHTIEPDIAVFVKYEFWFNYLRQLHRHKVPVVYVSAAFRNNQHFFGSYGEWFRKHLRAIDKIFVQNVSSRELLKSMGIRQVSVSGDTRFDRVATIPENAGHFQPVEKFAENRDVFLAGSTWPEDENAIYRLFQQPGNLNFIIAPHEVNEKRITQLEELFGKGNTTRFTALETGETIQSRILIVDTVGHLASLYRYATIAYIGGGFGAGIHNVLEAAAFGKPVIFGPNHRKFKEAAELISLKGAFLIENTDDLQGIVSELLKNKEMRELAAKTCYEYVQDNKGATSLIMQHLEEVAENVTT
jgi:3-deoxy-D-manno-octulosonic-acid transferase